LNSNKKDKPFTKLTKIKNKKTHINKIREERGDIKIDAIEF
jgi:hypothetical protein